MKEQSSLEEQSSLTSSALSEQLLAVLDDSQAQSVACFDISSRSSIADYVIIGSGRSQRHVMAIAGKVCDFLKTCYACNFRSEGYGQSGWVLIDASDVILHILTPEMRLYRNLERIWQ